MRLTNALVATVSLIQSINGLAVPSSEDATSLESRSDSETKHAERTLFEELAKRRGGGGGGGGRGGGGGSSGGSSSGGSSGGRPGGSSGGSSGSSSGSGGRGSGSSNSGGSTTTGSGVRPSYGGGRFYGGGASVPYSPGRNTPGGIPAALLAGGAIGFLGAAYLAGAYAYPYHNTYRYHNATTDEDEEKPVTCVCTLYEVCSCDDNGDMEYFNSLIGDGSYAGLNKSIVNVGRNETDNTTYIYILGTLPNGTTASGGSENPDGTTGAASIVQAIGWWPAVTTAIALAFLS